MRTRIALLMMTMLMVLRAAHGGPEEPRLRVDVRPSVAMAPASLRVIARLTPHENNRALHISADSAEYYRSSTIQLDGVNARAVEEVRFKDLPGGDYVIAVTLVEADGHQTTVGRMLQVMSRAAGGQTLE